MEDEIELRPATSGDAGLLFEWVNAPDSLKQKKETKEPVAREDHEVWLTRRLSDDACILDIIERGGVPVGQVRLEPKDGVYHVDIYIVPLQRGHGIAQSALRMLSQKVTVRPLVALVRSDNTASRNLFTALGFRQTGPDDEFVMYRLEE